MRLAVDTRPLRHRELRLLMAGQLGSRFGQGFATVGVPFQLYEITHSTLAVGILGVVEIVPILALALLGGALADAHDRRRLVLLSNLGTAATGLLLLINALLPAPSLIAIYALVAAQAGLEALQRPAQDAIIPRLVEPYELAATAALQDAVGTAASLAGPALGGVVISAVGLPWVYALNLACFLASLYTLWLMRAVPPPAGAERPSLKRVAEGFQYAFRRQQLLGTYAVDMVAMFFGMPSALFPAIADGLGGASTLGLLYAAPAFGAFLVTTTSGWTAHVHRHGVAIVLAATLWGLAIVVFGFAASLPLAIGALAVAGGADAVSGIFRQVVWNQTIPDELRGRLASIEMLSYTSGPALGNAESGLIATLFNLRVSIVSGGALCMVGCLACAVLLPRFWRYDARHFQSVARTAAAAPALVD